MGVDAIIKSITKCQILPNQDSIIDKLCDSIMMDSTGIIKLMLVHYHVLGSNIRFPNHTLVLDAVKQFTMWRQRYWVEDFKISSLQKITYLMGIIAKSYLGSKIYERMCRECTFANIKIACCWKCIMMVMIHLFLGIQLVWTFSCM